MFDFRKLTRDVLKSIGLHIKATTKKNDKNESNRTVRGKRANFYHHYDEENDVWVTIYTNNL